MNVFDDIAIAPCGCVNLAMRRRTSKQGGAKGAVAMTEEKIDLHDGTWTVRIKDSQCSIVDPQGRERHRSNSHASTGVHLAMELADHTFVSSESLDEAMRQLATNFTEK